MRLSVFVLILLSTDLWYTASSAGWSQQYGDARSTSYVAYTGPEYSEWMYTDCGWLAGANPAVSEDGVIFLPIMYLKLVAIHPNGTALWYYEPYDDDNVTLPLWNAVYANCHGDPLVIFAVIEGSTYGSLYQSFKIVALNADDGSVAWETEVFECGVRDQSFPTALSVDAECSYVFVGIGTNYMGQYGEMAKEGFFLALEFHSGTVVWNQTGLVNVGAMMATKTPHGRGKHLVLLPTNPTLDLNSKPLHGRLYAFAVDRQGTPEWHVDIDFYLLAEFSISNQGVIYGNTGLGSKEVVGIHIDNGKVIFQVDSACTNSTLLSGPAVDDKGHAYYRLMQFKVPYYVGLVVISLVWFTGK